ncbi:hypothetical protein BDV96DRAFT_140840 [Lophiotrema nucula]|uniref:Uncharacterized protein n=1 Tax=Lophiotrema nucula TaxID=690887 RepID=A0A6A5ZV96_9PLEO|nr:hypothetical protein BDV96DRAFT_140840 [Lophiotrema nucula]
MICKTLQVHNVAVWIFLLFWNAAELLRWYMICLFQHFQCWSSHRATLCGFVDNTGHVRLQGLFYFITVRHRTLLDLKR